MQKTAAPQPRIAETRPRPRYVDCNDLLLLGVALIWGTNTVVAKFLLQLVSPFQHNHKAVPTFTRLRHRSNKPPPRARWW